MAKKSVWKPDLTLDLHGMNLEQAFHAFDSILKRARELQKTKLLVIHGIGSGIMCENVYKWCDSLLYPYILKYSRAPIELGGQGAIMITIQKQKDIK